MSHYINESVHIEKEERRLLKWNKKERKIMLKFLNQIEIDEECKNEILNVSAINHSRTLMIYDQDLKIRISTDALIKLLQNPHHKEESIIEDIFVMTSKKVLFLRFKSVNFCQKVYHQWNFDPEYKEYNITFISVPDNLFEIAIDKNQSLVEETFHLFDENLRPFGLQIIDNFITEAEEQQLIEFAQNSFENAHCDERVSILKNREAIHFGYAFDYVRNTLVTDYKQVIKTELPEICNFLLKRFEKILPEKPDQLTINRYDGSKGDHIPMHSDTQTMCTEWIASLSLGSDVVMTWKCYQKLNCQDRRVLTDLSARSLVIMKDEARYKWEHGITKTTVDIVPMKNFPNRNRIRLSLRPRLIRYSFTFRKSSFQINIDQQMTSDPKELEANYVHETYDQIADHFSMTRYKGWPKVDQFLKSLPPYSLLLDVGCGNGRFLNVNPSIVSIGTDRSINLLNICHERNLETFRDDCLNVDNTIRENVFDAIISIAVIHHISTEKRRQRAVHAILNLLAMDGLALIYVWALEQNQPDGKASKYLKAKHDATTNENFKQISQLPIHQNRTEFREQDLLVPWTNKHEEKTFFRYYHVFNKGELETLIENVAKNETRYAIKIEQSYYDEGNLCVLVRKTKLDRNHLKSN